MPSFIDVVNGANADASAIQQVIDALKGTAGKGIPISITKVVDAIAFALSIQNTDATNSRCAQFLKADGTVMFQVDKNGVAASADGIVAATPILTLNGVQTLTNKTLTTPVLNTPTINTPVFAAGAILTAALAANAVTQNAMAVGVTANPTTVSATPVDLTDMAVTLTTGGGDVLVVLICAVQSTSTAAINEFTITQDAGADVSPVDVECPLANNPQVAVTMAKFAAPAAGAHTYKGRWSTSAGTATARAAQRYMLVIELKK
jgi:hypothetical protein